MLREMLEQIMDDEDELREINLSSRPRREERRKQRERERMERQLTRSAAVIVCTCTWRLYLLHTQPEQRGVRFCRRRQERWYD
jgi:hypothetical protein